MSGVVIASVVEGEGEVTAVPKLLHRIANDLGIYDLRTPRPSRIQRSKLVIAGGIESAVQRQSLRVGNGRGGVLVMLDADDDCPATLGPELLNRARKARGDVKIVVPLPSREFESWFLRAPLL